MKSGPTLVVEDFAQIAHTELEFGDLTVLVGAQGTGKSILLQWLKAALDGGEIVSALRDAGSDVDDPISLVDLIFGAGMSSGWREGKSRVVFDGRPVEPAKLGKWARRNEGIVYFVPAHRASLVSDGWATPFQKLSDDTPVVARLFSQRLYERFSRRAPT